MSQKKKPKLHDTLSNVYLRSLAQNILSDIAGIGVLHTYSTLKNVLSQHSLENYVKSNVDSLSCFNFMKRVSICNVYFP